MKKLKRFVLFVLILAGILALLKPTEADFESWVNNKASKERGTAKGENLIEKLADKGVTTVNQLQILGTYRYNNHYVLAIVDAKENGEKVHFVGIAGIWIPLP